MDLIAIGRIAKPIGTRGDVKVLLLTDDQKRFEGLRSVFVGDNEGSALPRDITSLRIDAKQVVLHFGGFESVEEAEQLRDQYLFVPQEESVKLNAGSYFVDEVIGCDVVTEEQKNVGIVTDILALPANDIWVVRNGEKEILIPAVKAIVRRVEIEKKRITIHALEGLIE
jgi:16S rRNA processing protein RimM